LCLVLGGIVEEAAQAGINASGIGGPVAIREELPAATIQHAMAFEAKGISRA